MCVCTLAHASAWMASIRRIARVGCKRQKTAGRNPEGLGCSGQIHRRSNGLGCPRKTRKLNQKSNWRTSAQLERCVVSGGVNYDWLGVRYWWLLEHRRDLWQEHGVRVQMVRVNLRLLECGALTDQEVFLQMQMAGGWRGRCQRAWEYGAGSGGRWTDVV